MARILGYATPDELISNITDIGRQIYVRPEDRKAFVDRLLAHGKVAGFEAQCRRRDGTHI